MLTITTKELRIGNNLSPCRVIDPENIPLMGYKICGTHLCYTDIRLNYDWQPLIITPDRLVNCGFVHKPHYRYSDGTPGERWQFRSFIICRLDSPGEWGMEYIDTGRKENLIPGDIKYVHELQNLYFALTREELQIKDYEL